MKEKISFACTIFNEEKTIGRFIESILSQSVKPNEIIIVDGGSKDKSVEIVKNYQKKSKIPIKLFVEKGNIAKGRNKYVKESSNDLLFTGDSGTRFEKNWIKKLMIGFEKGAEIVIGTYLPEKPKTLVEKIIASRFPDFSKFSKTDWKDFLPSNRQLAFRISSWKKLGDFPEWIGRADDTLMHMKAKKIGLKYYFAKDAKVYWHARDSLKSYLKLACLDSISDGICGIVWKRKIYSIQFTILGLLILSIPLSFLLSPWFLLSWIFFLGGIFLAGAHQIYKKTREFNCSFSGGLVMIGLFFAHAVGGLIGLIKAPFTKNKSKI